MNFKEKNLKKEALFILIGFLCGCALTVRLLDGTDYELDSAQMPKRIVIKRDGKPAGYARTTLKDAKIVNMQDLKDDPGVYIAFPMYSDHDGMERLVK